MPECKVVGVMEEFGWRHRSGEERGGHHAPKERGEERGGRGARCGERHEEQHRLPPRDL